MFDPKTIHIKKALGLKLLDQICFTIIFCAQNFLDLKFLDQPQPQLKWVLTQLKLT